MSIELGDGYLSFANGSFIKTIKNTSPQLDTEYVPVNIEIPTSEKPIKLVFDGEVNVSIKTDIGLRVLREIGDKVRAAYQAGRSAKYVFVDEAHQYDKQEQIPEVSFEEIMGFNT